MASCSRADSSLLGANQVAHSVCALMLRDVGEPVMKVEKNVIGSCLLFQPVPGHT